ncbi:XRE family transcriptional regulator [Roseivirga sp. BDSF3-8]|uniref:XRE family transcriptional regulator n=1 Tax=Roseivirga sp. BDSF3-8 TaxID=3241598 RepID=UPI00353254C9
MGLVNENIKWLRKKERLTQEQLAEKIGIKRSLLGAYEEGRADPRLNNLLNIARQFDVSVDTLLTKDVSRMSEDQLKAHSSTGTGITDNFRVLSITVDSEDRENIELVPQKAAAGYLNGYADPEYLEELPRFRLPNLPGGATYRAFEISGDSMLPLMPGTIIVGSYVESPASIRDGKTYVLVTQREGVVYKRVYRQRDDRGKEDSSLRLMSDNRSYDPYDVGLDEVIELWEARAFISSQFPEPEETDMSIEKLTNIVLNLQQEVMRLKK